MQKFVVDPFSAVPIGETARCRITVDKTNLKSISGCFSFYLHWEDGRGEKDSLFLYAEKVPGVKGCKFRLYNSIVARDESLVGTVSADVSGTSLTIYERVPGQVDARLWSGSVNYVKNLMGIRGPKKINVVIPGMSRDHNRVVPGQDGAAGRSRSGGTVELISKKPDWNTKSQSHELDFFGRARGCSSKNFQLVTRTNDKYIVLQFCKNDQHYKLDFSYPLCAVQAFGITLTTFVKSVNGI